MRARLPEPQRVVTQTQLERLKRDAVDEAVIKVWTIMFSILRDDFGWGAIRLKRLWDKANYLGDSLVKGYVTLEDLRDTLRDEAGIELK